MKSSWVKKDVCVFGEVEDNDGEAGFLLHLLPHPAELSHSIDDVIRLSTFNLPGGDLILSWS